MARTIRQFVEDMISDGKSLNHTIAVAKATVWGSYIQEINQIYKEFSKKLKKDFNYSKK